MWLGKGTGNRNNKDIKLPIILLLRLDKGCVKIIKMFRQEQLRILLKSKQRGNYIIFGKKSGLCNGIFEILELRIRSEWFFSYTSD